jgi:hypothetical protein
MLLLATVLLPQANGQTVYPIPNGTLIQYIDYGGAYANVFWADYPETINGTLYYVSGSVHYTPGNPAATYGNIGFTYYPPDGGAPVATNEVLTNIVITPFTVTRATLTADFTGSLFAGSLDFNIVVLSLRYGKYDLQNSSFTIGPGS